MSPTSNDALIESGRSATDGIGTRESQNPRSIPNRTEPRATLHFGLATVLLAFNEVGMAVQLQESLESSGYHVSWAGDLASGPTEALISDIHNRPDVVLLEGDRAPAELPAVVNAWRQLDPCPGIVVVGVSQAANDMADQSRAAFVPGAAELASLTAAIDHANTLRFASGMTPGLALRALGLERIGSDEDNALRIIAASRTADVEVVREALRWHAPHYVKANKLIDLLREHRALQIPEVELCNKLDGTMTVQTLLKSGPLDAWQAARLVWALTSITAVSLTPEPRDLNTTQRRGLAAARNNLRARYHRMQKTTYYDVLEVTPAADNTEIRKAANQLALRFAPDRLEPYDLSLLRQYAAPMWQQIVKARATLLDPADRGRYNDWISEHLPSITTQWLIEDDDAVAAINAYGKGQKALVAGDVHKAVSMLASACRFHPHHPTYEATLAWARFRAQTSTGKDKAAVASAERINAENALVGRRPFPQALVALGMLCAADNDARAARWYLNEALESDPNTPSARQLLKRLGRAGTQAR